MSWHHLSDEYLHAWEKRVRAFLFRPNLSERAVITQQAVLEALTQELDRRVRATESGE